MFFDLTGGHDDELDANDERGWRHARDGYEYAHASNDGDDAHAQHDAEHGAQYGNDDARYDANDHADDVPHDMRDDQRWHVMQDDAYGCCSDEDDD